MRLTRLEESHKGLEENQNNMLHQLSYLQQYMGHMRTPSFAPQYPVPFQPSPSGVPLQPTSLTPPTGMLSQSTLQSPPLADPCSSSSVCPSTPKRSAPVSNESPLPLLKTATNALPSSAINKEKLASVEEVMKKYPKLRQESKAGTLACKLAKEAIFGADIMKKCTPIGNRELPGLPEKELKVLKKAMYTRFPQYWGNKVEFEPVWKRCLESVQQCCKRMCLGKEKE